MNTSVAAVLTIFLFVSPVSAESKTSANHPQVPKLMVGENCTGNEQNCADVLQCEDSVCKIQNENECTHHQSMCVAGNLCAGTSDRKICKLPMPIGKPCKTDPYWVCAPGVKCHEGICRLPLPAEADCTPEGSICQYGLLCVGPADKLRCKMPMADGKPCKSDPYWVCEPGVHCTNNVCVAGTKTVLLGQLCAAKGLVCEEGTACAGHSKWKRCVEPRGVEQYCAEGSKYVCSEGLQCVWKRCVMPRGAGEYCQDGSRYVCADGLKCAWKRCREIVGEGADCKSNAVACEEGTMCVGKWWKRRCMTGKIEGGACGSDVYNFCADGLYCEAGICIEM